MSLAEVVSLARTPRSLRRIREVLAVLLKYGFGDLVGRLGRLRLVAGFGRLFRWRKVGREARRTLTTERRILLVLQDLGPTFIKFGQILANRPDLVPGALISELKNLQDRVKPFSRDEAEAAIQRELGRPSAEVFAEFAPEPIASASIAQVHRARLADGTEVAVKIRRPGIEHTIDSDLVILHTLAAAVERNLPELRRFDPVGLVREFSRSLRRELDFRTELYHLQRARQNFADEPRLLIPRPHPQYCTSGVLVMDFVDGVRITDRDVIEGWGLDVLPLVRAGMEITLRAVFEHRFFHADPHPGNFFVLRDGRICMLDFGIMGTIAEERLDHLLAFLHGLLTRDVSMVMSAMVDMGVLEDDTVAPELKTEIEWLLGRYGSLAIEDIDTMGLLDALLDLFFRYRVKPPADLLLVIKTLGILEGIVREVYPQFSPLQEVRSFVVPFFVDRLLDPQYHARVLSGRVVDSLKALQRLPARLDRLLKKVEAGEIHVSVSPDALAELGRQRRAATARLTMTGLTLLAGVATVVHLAGSPTLDWVGGVGLGATALLLGGALASVVRNR